MTSFAALRSLRSTVAAACVVGLAATAIPSPSHAASGVTADGYFRWTTDIHGIDTSMGAVVTPFGSTSRCSTSGGGCAGSLDNKVALYSAASASYVAPGNSPNLYDTSGVVVPSGHLYSTYGTNTMYFESGSNNPLSQMSGLVNYAALGPTQTATIFYGTNGSLHESFDITSGLVKAGSIYAAFLNVYALTSVLMEDLSLSSSSSGPMSIGDAAYASPAMAAAAALNATADVPEPVFFSVALLLALGVPALLVGRNAAVSA